MYRMKIDFLICSRRAFDTLKHHVQKFGAGTINSVVSYADKKVKNDPCNETIKFCGEKNICFCLKENYTADPNVFRILIGWQWLVIADGKTIVLHDSLLPRYRGFAPLVNSLINGEKEIGVSAFISTEGYDEGPLIRQEKINIEY